MTRSAAISLLILLTVGCQTSVSSGPAAAPNQAPMTATVEKPARVILFIADGAGISHFTLLDMLTGEESVLGRFSHTAMVRTDSANAIVTDSGASASAYATGVKVDNAAISVSPGGTTLPTVLELAEERGMATGLVTTTVFWDATPAAFAAHHEMRSAATSIMNQMLANDVDLIVSNGLQSFGREGRPTIDELAAAHGYRLVTEPERLHEAAEGNLLAVFPSVRNDMEHPLAPLPRLTEHAIQRLEGDEDGFFLMVESEGTDTGSHQNATDDVRDSLLSLNRAVASALRYAERRGDTLVIFTADHETGQLQIRQEGTPPVISLSWGTTGHTGQAVPVFAFGPGAEHFTGWLDNTNVGKRLFELLSD